MNLHQIQNPSDVFRRLGGLHDAEITGFEWSGDAVTLKLDDLFANFAGLPEYRGPRPCAIRFSDIERLSLTLESNSTECVTVYSCEVNERPSEEFEAKIRLAPGGLVEMVCHAIAGDFESSVLK